MRWLFSGIAVVVVVLLIELIAQIALPGIAADHVRDQLQSSGTVLDVSVKAFPALELLGHQADSVTVRMGTYHSTTAHLASLLEESNDTGSLHASAGLVTDGLMTLHNATLTKHGSELTGTATIDEKDLTHAIPLVKSVTPVASSGGVLTLKGTADIPILGDITVPFVVAVRNGGIIAYPNLPVVASLGTVQIFSNPHIAIDKISARKTLHGFTVFAQGHLR